MFRKILGSKEGVQMNDLVKFVIQFFKDLPKLRAEIELADGKKIEEDIDKLKEELEKELRERDSR